MPQKSSIKPLRAQEKKSSFTAERVKAKKLNIIKTNQYIIHPLKFKSFKKTLLIRRVNDFIIKSSTYSLDLKALLVGTIPAAQEYIILLLIGPRLLCQYLTCYILFDTL